MVVQRCDLAELIAVPSNEDLAIRHFLDEFWGAALSAFAKTLETEMEKCSDIDVVLSRLLT